MANLPQHDQFNPPKDDAGILKLNFPTLDRANGEQMATRAGEPSRTASSGETDSLGVERQIEEMLANAAPKELVKWGLKPGQDPPRIPPVFRNRLRRLGINGKIPENVERYYLNLRRGDSTSFPDQNGGKSVVQAILKQDALSRIRKGKVDRWRPVRVLGTGGFGSVILWEKHRRYGPPLLLATKDTRVSTSFFQDYCSEAQVTRRLNDIGCLNVIKVLDWAYISKQEPHFRIAYEYAEYGDLFHLVEFYRKHGLIFPEAFIWHIFYSIANALCYCRYGTNDPKPDATIQGWDQIIHGDMKPENVFLSAPDPAESSMYPCVKLGDFGLSYTLGGPLTSVQSFKSLFRYGTEQQVSTFLEGDILLTYCLRFMAPEVSNTAAERLNRTLRPDELHGNHSDIWGLAAVLFDIYRLVDVNLPKVAWISKAFQDYEFYSSQLTNLISTCRHDLPSRRPEIHTLYLQTKSHVAFHRAHAYVEEATAVTYGNPNGVFHNKILFSKKDQNRFEQDRVFREHYRRANLMPLWTKFGMVPLTAPARPPPPSLPAPRQPARFATPLDEDEFAAGDAPPEPDPAPAFVRAAPPARAGGLAMPEAQRRAWASQERRRTAARRGAAVGGWWGRIPRWWRER